MGQNNTKEQVVKDLLADIDTMCNTISEMQPDWKEDSNIPIRNFILTHVIEQIRNWNIIGNTTPQFIPYKLGLSRIRLSLPGGGAYFFENYHNAIQKKIAEDFPVIRQTLVNENEKNNLELYQNIIKILDDFHDKCDQYPDGPLVYWGINSQKE